MPCGLYCWKNETKLVDIFTGDDTWSIAYDSESKFVESGLGRVTLHEKKILVTEDLT